MTEYYIDGICCELCRKKLGGLCPVETAQAWSAFSDFCGQFQSKDGSRVIDILTKKLQGNHYKKPPDSGLSCRGKRGMMKGSF